MARLMAANRLKMTRAEYEEIRPRLVEILDEHAPLSAPDLHAKYMEAFELDEKEASHCLWRMLDDGYMYVRPDLRVEVGEFARA